MGLFGKKDGPKPKPPARPEQVKPVAKPPSLGNTINLIKQRKKMLDEI